MQLNIKSNQIDTKKTYYSNGKLLLTGEYLVLDGALSLGLPTKKGQNLVVEAVNTPVINWESIDSNAEIWFKESFSLPLQIQNSTAISKVLVTILIEARKLNPSFLNDSKGGSNIKTNLDFPMNWGLGSSSTLINNIAQWAEINAFELLENTMGGSGYDIACGQNDFPILYQINKIDVSKPLVKPIDFRPSFNEQLYFIHLNKKQRSNKEITRYQKLKKGIPEAVHTVSEITNLITKTTKLDDFDVLMQEHESILSSILQTPTIQEQLFSDYFGQLKSLGAWGGDFILATGNDDTPKYFKNKGFNTIIRYKDMILN